tara:strand:+ start:50 stop:580 length:531 start_codon:yes stop_codon:yes gene_type:complete
MKGENKMSLNIGIVGAPMFAKRLIEQAVPAPAPAPSLQALPTEVITDDIFSFLPPNRQVILATALSHNPFDLPNNNINGIGLQTFINRQQCGFEKQKIRYCKFKSSLNVMDDVRDLNPQPWSTVRKTWEDYRDITHTNTKDACINYLDRAFVKSGWENIRSLEQEISKLLSVRQFL